MKKTFIMLLCLLWIGVTFSTPRADEEDVAKIQELTTGLGANDLGDMVWDGSSLWIEGSGSLTNLVGEGHHVTDWISHKQEEGFGQGSISALYALDQTLITAWGYPYVPG